MVFPPSVIFPGYIHSECLPVFQIDSEFRVWKCLVELMNIATISSLFLVSSVVLPSNGVSSLVMFIFSNSYIVLDSF